jgi:hypothetical protein
MSQAHSSAQHRVSGSPNGLWSSLRAHIDGDGSLVIFGHYLGPKASLIGDELESWIKVEAQHLARGFLVSERGLFSPVLGGFPIGLCSAISAPPRLCGTGVFRHGTDRRDNHDRPACEGTETKAARRMRWRCVLPTTEQAGEASITGP